MKIGIYLRYFYNRRKLIVIILLTLYLTIFTAISHFLFSILGVISIDALIGVNLLLFFYFSYKYLKITINHHFYNIYKSVVIYYVSLINYIIALKKITLSVNRSYFTFMKNNLIIISNAIHEVKAYWADLNFFIVKQVMVNNTLYVLDQMLRQRRLSTREWNLELTDKIYYFTLLFGFSRKVNFILKWNYYKVLSRALLVKVLKENNFK